MAPGGCVAAARGAVTCATPTSPRPSGDDPLARVARRELEVASADLTLRLSQVEINVPLGRGRLPSRGARRRGADDAGRVARGGAAWPSRSTPVKLAKRARVRVRAHAKVNLDLRVLGTRADGYHELRTVFQSIELHDTLVCAERPGPFTLKCRTPGVPLDDVESGLEGGGGVVDGARACGRAARCGRSRSRSDPDGGGARRRQRRRRRRAAGARAVVGRRAADAAARSGRRHRRRRAVLPVRRHRARPRARRGDLSARRSAAALGRHRPAAVRRVDRRGVRLVRRGPRGRADENRASCRSCRCPGRRARRR